MYHKGWDEGNVGGRQWGMADLTGVQALADDGFKGSGAGALNLDSLSMFVNVPVAVFVVGRAIREADDPVAEARRYREAIAQYWV